MKTLEAAALVVLGAATFGVKSASAQTPVVAMEITCGWDHVCVLTDDNRVKCFGSGANGQLGYDDTADRTADATLPYVELPQSVKHVSAGNGHTCATLVDGTGVCWGLNDVNQLGDSVSAMAVNPMAQPIITAGAQIEKIEAFDGNSCILAQDGTVSCFGKPEGLGTCATTNKLAPGDAITFASAMTSIADIARSRNGLCAKDGNELIQCFGDNTYGQLGIGSTDNVGDGTVVPCVNVDSTAPLNFPAQGAGNDFTPEGLSSSLGTTSCAFAYNGEGTCWGWNADGQLGQESNEEFVGDDVGEMNTLAYLVRPSGTIQKLVGGNTHSCMLDDSNAIYCWGDHTNLFGYGADVGLSVGDMTSLAPVDFGSGAGSPMDVCVGPTYTCVLLDDGTPRCWGSIPSIGADPTVAMSLGNIPTSAPTTSTSTPAPGPGPSPTTPSPTFSFGPIPPLEGVDLEDERKIGGEQLIVGGIIVSLVVVVIGSSITTSSMAASGGLASGAAKAGSSLDAMDVLEEAAREKSEESAEEKAKSSALYVFISQTSFDLSRILLLGAAVFALYNAWTLMQSLTTELGALRAEDSTIADIALNGSQTASQIASALGMQPKNGVSSGQFLDLCDLDERVCVQGDELGLVDYFYVQMRGDLALPLTLVLAAVGVELLVTLAETILWARSKCVAVNKSGRVPGDLPIPVLVFTLSATLGLLAAACGLYFTAGPVSFDAVAWLDNGTAVAAYTVPYEIDTDTYITSFACPSSALEPCTLDGTWYEATNERIADYGFVSGVIIAIALAVKDVFSIARHAARRSGRRGGALGARWTQAALAEEAQSAGVEMQSPQQQRGFAKKKKKSSSAKKVNSDLPQAARPEDEMLVRMLTAQPRNEKPEFSEEELLRREVIAKRYAKMTQLRDKYDDAEVGRRAALQDFALMALPSQEERDIALKDPAFNPPMHRQIWTWTPPREI
ncbi:X-linked retinitis pigmentosa GTPase regulator [Hondaea fermentalgiana]|uniref:X-linked retinitis pigmentosa GTPase regulator n=1 Tax=Hondaea fermentalgiana TaxID=2315210 RepID=A0A2R5GE09_9STRA|nr:X-linked retinitis pigmentosa GTPase regulator [Hondaea fermentalgiana]|eukprot:GBG28805.1 X-linked retinitis pigmentosa GTPase regulator [Hondaea fermentalgiana]